MVRFRAGGGSISGLRVFVGPRIVGPLGNPDRSGLKIVRLSVVDRAGMVARGILAAHADLVNQVAPRRVAAEPDVAVMDACDPVVHVLFEVRARIAVAAGLAVDGFGCEALPPPLTLVLVDQSERACGHRS